MKFNETRILMPSKLREICIRHDWYTMGDNDEYSALFDRLYDADGCYEQMSTDKLTEIAEDIVQHSEIEDYTIEAVLFTLAAGCTTYFDPVEA